MIDRRAINILYNDQVGKKLVEDFYQLLVVYSQNEKIKPVESYLLKLNERRKHVLFIMITIV